MPTYYARPRGLNVNTEQARRHWNEAPCEIDRAKLGAYQFPHHETLYESSHPVFYIVHTYDDISGVESHPGWTTWVKHRPAWAEVVCRGEARDWLLKNGHDMNEI